MRVVYFAFVSCWIGATSLMACAESRMRAASDAHAYVQAIQAEAAQKEVYRLDSEFVRKTAADEKRKARAEVAAAYRAGMNAGKDRVTCEKSFK